MLLRTDLLGSKPCSVDNIPEIRNNWPIFKRGCRVVNDFFECLARSNRSEEKSVRIEQKIQHLIMFYRDETDNFFGAVASLSLLCIFD